MLTLLTELSLFVHYKCCIGAYVLAEKFSCSFYLTVHVFDIVFLNSKV